MKRPKILAICALILIAVGQTNAQSTSLLVDVVSPLPPITPSDIVSLRALTPVEVFPDTGHLISSSFTVNGFDVDWDITSVEQFGIVLPVLTPMGTINAIGPLAPGTYNVTANWNHVGPGLLPGAPSSGTGFRSFTVIPEPSTCLLMAIGTLAAPLFGRRAPRPVV